MCTVKPVLKNRVQIANTWFSIIYYTSSVIGKNQRNTWKEIKGRLMFRGTAWVKKPCRGVYYLRAKKPVILILILCFSKKTQLALIYQRSDKRIRNKDRPEVVFTNKFHSFCSLNKHGTSNLGPYCD
jgi:hypothetical protein